MPLNATSAGPDTRRIRAFDVRRAAVLSVFVLAASIAGLVPAAVAVAAEAPASTESTADDAGSEQAPPATGSERRRAGDKGGVFRPSEDISEDVAITFPVDI